MLFNMSIQADHWIRARAKEGMIEPFADRQVRQEGDAKIISYGLSSFGYDLRAAREWKIFVNAFHTVVDPKEFDSSAFVDFEGDECIIPPNSFVLARSVEYLRIPENVMVVAVGKSSYARCFSGDTRVALVDGSSPTLEEMARRAEKGEMFWGYSLSQHGRIEVTLLENPRFIARDSLLEIELDNGERIKATPDHQFIVRDGRSVMAKDLKPNDSLMPLYRKHFRGYEMTYQPLQGFYDHTDRLGTDWKVRHGLNSSPKNLEHINANKHMKILEHVLHPLENDIRGYDPVAHIMRSYQGVGIPVVNHKIVAIRELPGEHDTYCLTVPEAGNFALEAGVFVHNCGVVANVTPLEPGWEGHVTLEFSNTTPLPARMYANEGCVQLLFFEGERPEVTYADRKGKYQGQTGVTLPRL